jgi:hypothetical protein
MIPITTIDELLRIGRSEQLDEPHVFDSLAHATDLRKLNTVYWTDWEAATTSLNDEDMVALIKALTVMDNRVAVGGSVAGVIWVYNFLERRNPERAHSLDEWIKSRTPNPYADFATRRKWNAGAGDRQKVHQARQDEERRKAVERKAEQLAAQMQQSNQARAERTKTLTELQPLRAGERILRIAEKGEHPPEYFPEPWANLTNDELRTFGAAGRNQVIQWLSQARKGPWRRLYEQLERIQ